MSRVCVGRKVPKGTRLGGLKNFIILLVRFDLIEPGREKNTSLHTRCGNNRSPHHFPPAPVSWGGGGCRGKMARKEIINPMFCSCSVQYGESCFDACFQETVAVSHILFQARTHPPVHPPFWLYTRGRSWNMIDASGRQFPQAVQMRSIKWNQLVGLPASELGWKRWPTIQPHG